MWSEHLRDIKPLKGVYGDAIPKLHGLLHEVILHQDGPSLKLRMDLKEFPKELPKKWVEKNFNTAQITLLLSDVSALLIEGWAKNASVEIEIKSADSEIELTLQSEPIQLSCKAASLSVLE